MPSALPSTSAPVTDAETNGHPDAAASTDHDTTRTVTTSLPAAGPARGATMPSLQTSDSPQSSGAELQPYRVELDRHGNTTIMLRAPLLDSQTFQLTLPRHSVGRALRSLVVTDSRGPSPAISVPSPPPTLYAPADDESAWASLLAHSRGANASISSRAGDHSGTLLGLVPNCCGDPPPVPLGAGASSLSSPRDHGIVVLGNGGALSMHVVEDPHCLSVQVADDAAAAAAAVDVHLPRLAAHRPMLSIVIKARGVGPGVLTAMYEIGSCHKPAFDLMYRIDVPGTDEADARFPDARLRCTAVVPNPTQFDLRDVELCLITSGSRGAFGKIGHLYDHATCRGGSSSSPPVSRADDDTETSESDSRSVYLAPGSETDEEACDLDSEELHSVSLHSDTDSDTPHKSCVRIEVPTRLNVDARQSAVMPLFDKTCEARLTHILRLAARSVYVMKRYLVIRNTTDEALEPGAMTIVLGDGSTTIFRLVNVLDINHERYSERPGECWVSGRGRATKHISDVTSCSMESDHMVMRVEWERAIRFDIHNKKDTAVDVVVQFITSVVGDYDQYAVAMLYEEARHVGREDAATRIARIEEPIEGVPRYLVRLQGGMKRVLVVKEKAYRDQRMHVLKACSPRVVMRLRRLDAVSTEVMATLQGIGSVNRMLRTLKARRKRHGRKMDRIKGYGDRQADGYWSPNDTEENGEHDADRNLHKYLRSIQKVDDCVARLRTECDDIVKKMVDEEAEFRRLCDLLTSQLSSVSHAVVGE